VSDLKVKITPPTRFGVSINDSNKSYTLKNTTVTSNRLDKLTDVNEVDAARISGALLIYDAPTDTYILRDLLTYDEPSNTFKLDGGSEF
jgi:hypothetical protein